MSSRVELLPQSIPATTLPEPVEPAGPRLSAGPDNSAARLDPHPGPLT
jgi:hypothetical protein